MRNVYMPNSAESQGVLAAVASPQMPYHTGTDIVSSDGMTTANLIQDFINYGGTPTPYYVVLCCTKEYPGYAPTPAQIADVNRAAIIFFSADDMVYNTIASESPYFNLATWFDDDTYTNRIAYCGQQVEYISHTWNRGSYINTPTTAGNWLLGAVFNTCDMYILESTVPLEYAGEEYAPDHADERFFTKEYDAYAFNVGVACNDRSHYDSSSGIWSTDQYKISLRWISPRTGHSFSVPLDRVLIKQVPSVVTPDDHAVVRYTYSYSGETGNIAKALRMPVGAYSDPADIPSAWEDLTDVRSVTTMSLQWLLDIASTQTEGVEQDDLFTDIYADFYVGTSKVDTKSIDYSSLYGEDIDINEGTITDPNYDPDIADENAYTDSVPLTTPAITCTSIFNRTYTMDLGGIGDLCNYLYNADDSVFEEIVEGVLTRGNPIESLIDLRLYPFDVRAFTGAGTAEFIKFGRTQTGITATRLPYNSRSVISLGSCQVVRQYGNFLDYLQDVKLYIPFCGMVDLPIDRVLNHTISISLIVDYVTGAGTAVVYCDNIPILYRQGVIAVSIPMTATNSAEFGKTIVGNLIKTGEAAASKDASGGITGALNTVSSIFNGSHLQTVGSSSPQVSLYQPKNAYLLMSYVVPADGVYDNTFADLVGYAMFKPVASISEMTGKGFTVFDNVRVDVPSATEAEREMIRDYLTSGVFV